MADDAAVPSGESGTTDGESFEPESRAIELGTADELGTRDDAVDVDDAVDTGLGSVEARSESSHVRLALIVGLVAVVALAGVTGWLGYRANESRALQEQRQEFLQIGRQGALNLTTLDFEHIDDDVQRVLDSATGAFYDDFQQRSASFTQVVKQVKSKSVGTVTEAALVEPTTPTEAQVIVAVTVKSELTGQPEQPPRSWRMRISVQKVDDDVKVSNVEFVP